MQQLMPQLNFGGLFGGGVRELSVQLGHGAPPLLLRVQAPGPKGPAEANEGEGAGDQGDGTAVAFSAPAKTAEPAGTMAQASAISAETAALSPKDNGATGGSATGDSATGDSATGGTATVFLGERVRVRKIGRKDPLQASVRFLGETSFAPGLWVGVELDDPLGTNDGKVQGIRYFSTKASHGLFSRPERVIAHTDEMHAGGSALKKPQTPPQKTASPSGSVAPAGISSTVEGAKIQGEGSAQGEEASASLPENAPPIGQPQPRVLIFGGAERAKDGRLTEAMPSLSRMSRLTGMRGQSKAVTAPAQDGSVFERMLGMVGGDSAMLPQTFQRLTSGDGPSEGTKQQLTLQQQQVRITKELMEQRVAAGGAEGADASKNGVLHKVEAQSDEIAPIQADPKARGC